MSDGPITRPYVVSPETAERHRRMQPDDPGPRKFGNVNSQDHRVSAIIKWLAGLGALFIGAGGIGVIKLLWGLDTNVAILLSRPIPVSKEQYDSDMRSMREEISTIKSDVKNIQTKQADTINRRLP